MCTYSAHWLLQGLNSPWDSVRTPVDHLGTLGRHRGCQGWNGSWRSLSPPCLFFRWEPGGPGSKNNLPKVIIWLVSDGAKTRIHGSKLHQFCKVVFLTLFWVSEWPEELVTMQIPRLHPWGFIVGHTRQGSLMKSHSPLKYIAIIQTAFAS